MISISVWIKRVGYWMSNQSEILYIWKAIAAISFNWIRSLNMENEENVLNFMNRNEFMAGFGF